jgi:hypothetical protein
MMLVKKLAVQGYGGLPLRTTGFLWNMSKMVPRYQSGKMADPRPRRTRTEAAFEDLLDKDGALPGTRGDWSSCGYA